MVIHVLLVILIALAPCVFWLWIIYKRDKYAPEPMSLIIRTFLLGAAIAIPVAIVELAVSPAGNTTSLTLLEAAYQAFIVAGITEELGKFLVVRLTMYKSIYFEEPADGLVYAAAAALGFAALENIVYLFTYGWKAILIRGLVSNLAHVLFSGFWGYPLSLHKLGIPKSRGWVWLGLIAAILAHGIFDFLLFTSSIYSLAAIPFFMAMAGIFILMFRHANKISIYVQHRVKD
jgi:protease PrsW